MLINVVSQVVQIQMEFEHELDLSNETNGMVSLNGTMANGHA